jgi:hypothetical protein
MALPSTHSSVNGPSEKITGLDFGLHQEVYTLEKEDQCHTPMDQPCNATELCMFIGCKNYYCSVSPSRAHIIKSLTDQSSLTTYFINRQNTKAFVQWVSL